MLARGLYACYEKEGAAFVPRYKSFLKATAVMTAEDAGKVADIDLTDVDFWRSGLEGLAKEVEEFGELCRLG
jgi:oligoendopeptidase F